MKIESQDSNLMVIKDGKLTSSIIIGIIFLVLGLGAIYIGIVPKFQVAFAIFGLIFAILGASYVFLSKEITIKLDKTQGKMSINRKGLLGADSNDVELNKIKEVLLQSQFEIKTTSVAQGSGTPAIRNQRISTDYKYTLYINLDNGESQIFELGTGGGTVVNMNEDKREMSQRIANFLGVPFREVNMG